MNFFMDENFIVECLYDLAEKLPVFEKIVDVMDEISSSEPTKLYYINNLHSLVFRERAFADLLYAHSADGDYRDLILRFDMAIERGDCVLPEGGRAIKSGIIELASHGVGGCITRLDYSTENWWRSGKMCIAFDQESFQKTLRLLFNALEMQPEQLSELGEIMFPNIYFHADPALLKRMGIGYREFADSIIGHLSYLNDFAMIDFKSELPAEIIQLAASKGVEISPESVKTHRNKAAMSKRKININDSQLLCEWHTKFTYDKGRIHFHARPGAYHENIRKITGSKVIVGLIAEHLPT